MKYLVVYAHKDGFGNVDCDFIHEPPTMQDIREAELDISARLCNFEGAIIVNWIKINDEI